MDIDTIRGIVDTLFMVAFLGIIWYAYSGKNQARFDDASHLPFNEGE